MEAWVALGFMLQTGWPNGDSESEKTLISGNSEDSHMEDGHSLRKQSRSQALELLGNKEEIKADSM